MRYFSSFAKFIFAIVFIFCSFTGRSQIILNYAADTSGALSTVAANATGDSLKRVHRAVEPDFPCVAGGFSTRHFQSLTTFDTSAGAIQVSVTANSGYVLNITGFTSQLRRSNTGPDSIRYAYSTDGGLTWPYQAVSFSPYNGSCGAIETTASWAAVFSVGAPNALMFRVYGYDALDTLGELQIENLLINGYVVVSDGCTIPTGLSASGITYSSATLNWSPVSGAATYIIQYRPLGSTTWTTATSSTTAINITGLTCNTTYEYAIQTACTGGLTSSFSGSSLFTTHICPCPVPSGLADSAITATSAKLYWSTALWSVNYKIRYRKATSSTWDSTIVSGTELDLTGLNCGTDYQFQVQNLCVDTSAYSDTFMLSTLSCACPTPSGLTTTGATATTDTLNWPPVTGALYYTVNYRPLGATVWTSDTTTWTLRKIAGLTCGTQYEFQVSSYCSVTSSSSFSHSDTFNTTSCPCPTPAGLAAANITATTAILSWTGVVWASYYNFAYRKVGTTTWIIDTSHTTSRTISGLTCGTTYEVKLQCYCPGLNGLGSFTAPVTFATSNCLPVSASSGTMAVYFNQPVDTTVSTGTKAVYLNNSMADTIIAYISRAKYSIDIAQFDYNQTTGFSNIATAINSAYAAGITIRWIYDGSQPNTGLSSLVSGIHTLASPTTAAYGTMHNKFMIIDAGSASANDAIISTGSATWNDTGLNLSYGNLIFIQDSGLAHLYEQEFNMMWGGAGTTPNTALSKFGPFKTAIGRDSFMVGGNLVELYFSPADATDSHVQSTIATANTDLYFGVYNFGGITDALAINSVKSSGVYTAGIIDQASTTGSAYSILSTTLLGNLRIYMGTYQYDNQFLIVDPSDFCSDPIALTGSCDWTTAANTMNDENTVIIHNSTIANEYYQSFKANFITLGGTLNHISNCSLAHVSGPVFDFMEDGNSLLVHPNPVEHTTTISYRLSGSANIDLAVYNMFGQQVLAVVNNESQDQGEYAYPVSLIQPGVYFVKFTIGEMTFTRKIVKL